MTDQSCQCVHNDAERCYERTSPFRRLLVTDPVDELEQGVCYSYCHCPCHHREVGPVRFVFTGGAYWRLNTGGGISRVDHEDLPLVSDLFSVPREGYEQRTPVDTG